MYTLTSLVVSGSLAVRFLYPKEFSKNNIKIYSLPLIAFLLENKNTLFTFFLYYAGYSVKDIVKYEGLNSLSVLNFLGAKKDIQANIIAITDSFGVEGVNKLKEVGVDFNKLEDNFIYNLILKKGVNILNQLINLGVKPPELELEDLLMLLEKHDIGMLVKLHDFGIRFEDLKSKDVKELIKLFDYDFLGIMQDLEIDILGNLDSCDLTNVKYFFDTLIHTRLSQICGEPKEEWDAYSEIIANDFNQAIKIGTILSKISKNIDSNCSKKEEFCESIDGYFSSILKYVDTEGYNFFNETQEAKMFLNFLGEYDSCLSLSSC